MFLVIQNGKYQEINEDPNLKIMQNCVGIPGKPAYIGMATNEFSDPHIDLVFDEEFLFKNLSPTCITPRTRNVLHGVVLAVANKVSNEGVDTVGLTPEQAKIIKDELPIATEIIGNLVVFEAGEHGEQ